MDNNYTALDFMSDLALTFLKYNQNSFVDITSNLDMFSATNDNNEVHNLQRVATYIRKGVINNGGKSYYCLTIDEIKMKREVMEICTKFNLTVSDFEKIKLSIRALVVNGVVTPMMLLGLLAIGLFGEDKYFHEAYQLLIPDIKNRLTRVMRKTFLHQGLASRLPIIDNTTVVPGLRLTRKGQRAMEQLLSCYSTKI